MANKNLVSSIEFDFNFLWGVSFCLGAIKYSNAIKRLLFGSFVLFEKLDPGIKTVPFWIVSESITIIYHK